MVDASRQVRRSDDVTVRQNYKRCDCHSSSGGHLFRDDLVCATEGCEVNWHQYQIQGTPCEGKKRPTRGRPSEFLIQGNGDNEDQQSNLDRQG